MKLKYHVSKQNTDEPGAYATILQTNLVDCVKKVLEFMRK